MNKPGEWSIQTLWNDLITEERSPQPRDYIRGSEVGKNFFFRYLQMKGVPYTNHFDSRILRVFDCGHIFEEDIMKRIFNLLGLLITTQDEVIIEEPGLLKVIGHHDPRLGGKIDLDKVKENISDPSVSDWMRVRVLELAVKLHTQYPNGLEDLITEMKTVNSMAFWAHKNQDPETGFFGGYPHHKLQLWTYLKGKNHEKGRLFYMSKDDLTLMETPVLLGDKKLKKLWFEDIKTMTALFNKGTEMAKVGQEIPYFDANKGEGNIPDWLKPYIPPNVVYNENKKKYEANWEVGRSNYMTLLTGYKTVDEWEGSIRKELSLLNRDKCKTCQKEFSIDTLSKYNGNCGKCSKLKGVK